MNGSVVETRHLRIKIITHLRRGNNKSLLISHSIFSGQKNCPWRGALLELPRSNMYTIFILMISRMNEETREPQTPRFLYQISRRRPQNTSEPMPWRLSRCITKTISHLEKILAWLWNFNISFLLAAFFFFAPSSTLMPSIIRFFYSFSFCVNQSQKATVTTWMKCKWDFSLSELPSFCPSSVPLFNFHLLFA